MTVSSLDDRLAEFERLVQRPLRDDSRGNASTGPQWESLYRQAHGTWRVEHHGTPVPAGPQVGFFGGVSASTTFVATFGAAHGDLVVELRQPAPATWWRILLRVLVHETLHPGVPPVLPDALADGVEARLALGKPDTDLVGETGRWRRLHLLSVEGAQAPYEAVVDLRSACSDLERAVVRAEWTRRLQVASTRLVALESHGETRAHVIDPARDNVVHLTTFLSTLDV